MSTSSLPCGGKLTDPAAQAASEVHEGHQVERRNRAVARHLLRVPQPEAQRLALARVRQVLVFALDRLGRSLRDLLLLLDDLAASLAEFERELIRDRVRSGLARVKATGRTRSGRAIGRPRRDVDLGAVTELRGQGRSWREIAQVLHVPRRTLTRAWALEQNPGLDSAA